MARKVKTIVEVEGHLEEVEVELPDEELPAWKKEDLTCVGKSIPRPDGIEKCTGQARYTHDVHLPRMLYGKILRSPHPHARVVKIDTTRALKLPGVKAVLSAENAPPIPFFDDSFLFDPILRCVGEEVAAVAAVNEYMAQDALGLIQVDYELLPFVVDPREALKPGAPPLRSGGNLVGGKPEIYSRGDVEKGLAEADVIVEETFTTQIQTHACWETHGSVAVWEGDHLTVWDSTQGVSVVQEQLADALKMPASKIRVIKDFMGGGFGSKASLGKYTLIAVLLAKATGRPVKITLDRKEEFLATGHRPASFQQVKLGARRDGTLTAIVLKNIGGCGAHRTRLASPLSLVEVTSRPYRELYLCPNMKTEVYSVYSNISTNTAQRAPGHVEGTFGLEQAMDQLAERLGMDPVTLRLKNYALKDQVRNLPYSSKALDQCYQQGARAIGWKDKKKKPGEGESGPRKRGIGMASQIWGGGGGPPAFALVKIYPDGTAQVLTGTQDLGTGSKVVFCQIAAEELGIRPEEVSIILGDTATTPYAPTSGGSRTVPSVGPAVRVAAASAKRQLLDLAAPLLKARPEELTIKEGVIYLQTDPSRRISLKEAAKEMGRNAILGMGSRSPNPPTASINTFGAQYAEVEVDTETGEVRVLRVVSIHDAGRVINPMTLNNQIEGGVTQGIGYGLLEECVWDGGIGVLLNANLHDYKLPTMLDLPEIQAGAVDSVDPATHVGAKGVGEPPMIPTAAAIANAIYNATGVRIRDLPITPDKVLKALKG